MSTSFPSSLDTTSSTIQPSIGRSYRDYLLEYCAPEMRAVEELYESVFAFHARERLDKCRSFAQFMREKATGKVRVSASSCHVRFCPLCSRSRAATIRINTTNWLLNQSYPKMVTLTLRHSDTPLSEQIDRLYKAFKELRRLKLFEDNVSGGIWFLEIKKGKDDLWHPHLHCLVAGKLIPVRALSRCWQRLTADSPIVHVVMVKDAKIAADYVAKYAVKPCELRYLSLSDRQELLMALKRRRLTGTWKSAKKERLTAKPAYCPANWERLGYWHTVVNLKGSDADAAAIWNAFKKGEPLEENVSMAYIDDFIANRSESEVFRPPDLDPTLF